MSLTPTQRAFATSREPFPAFIGGFGSGKTAAAIARAMALKAHYRDCDIAYYLPTFPLVEDIALRRFPELCERKGWAFKVRAGNNPQIEFPGAGRIIFRTMENPQRIVGYEVAHSIVDELDTLPIDKARDAWNKIIARNRQKCSIQNTVAVATTPEGFRFVYERWVKDPKPGYVTFNAKTMDNEANLPPDYIANLRATYSTSLLAAYLSTLALTLTSPATILAFVAIFAGLGIGAASGSTALALQMVAGVFSGSALWWLILSMGGGLLRSRLQTGSLHVLHVCSGLGIIALGGWQLALFVRHWLHL